MEKFIKFYCQNWKFWYKVTIVILSIFGLLTDYFWNIFHLDKVVSSDETNNNIYPWAVYDKTGTISHWNYAGYTMSWFSFFTTQTNILVLIWFLIAIKNHLQEEKSNILQSYFSLATAVYITITCLIFNFLLLPMSLLNTNIVLNVWQWIAQLLLHTFIPILTVVYIIVFAKHAQLISTKLVYKKKIGLFFIYPIIYLIYGVGKGLLCEYSGMDVNTAYQYFFLQVTNPNILGLPGIVWLIIISILICGIIFLFTGLYNFAYLVIAKYSEKKIS
ncbi:Pr6Pr family membrane protein [Spiroplasma endosymbiont of Polydrusus pterygomalis]|uniref:Pr6Pr family membrane protein n=1 Tax=Spiroplasma endosymbiont of Polydrusus pterygomalis TaxID=3139327 RepID=UPI003CCB3073